MEPGAKTFNIATGTESDHTTKIHTTCGKIKTSHLSLTKSGLRDWVPGCEHSWQKRRWRRNSFHIFSSRIPSNLFKFGN